MSMDALTGHARAIHNQICVVHDCEMARVVGIHRDAFDAYYICLRMNDVQHESNRYYASMVGAAVSLRDIDRYDRIDAVFALNGAPPSDTFIETTATREENEALYGKDFDRMPADEPVS